MQVNIESLNNRSIIFYISMVKMTIEVRITRSLNEPAMRYKVRGQLQEIDSYDRYSNDIQQSETRRWKRELEMERAAKIIGYKRDKRPAYRALFITSLSPMN